MLVYIVYCLLCINNIHLGIRWMNRINQIESDLTHTHTYRHRICMCTDSKSGTDIVQNSMGRKTRIAYPILYT